MNLKEEITPPKKEENAFILAPYYQIPEIQDVADYVGNSLNLSHKSAETSADIIVFLGVHFMAKTAKILNPTKTVVLPDLEVRCSLPDSCLPDAFKDFKDPDHIVITYTNCVAEIKAMSDLVCTSSKALKTVESVLKEIPIIFAPDKILGPYISKVLAAI
ncbi:MAG: quinolinate synthase NadA [Xanthomarina sp.]